MFSTIDIMMAAGQAALIRMFRAAYACAAHSVMPGTACHENAASGILHDGVDAAQGVQCAREADVRQHLGQSVDQVLPGVAHIRVALYMGLDLRLAAAQRADDGKGQKLTGLQVETFTRIKVAETECGEAIHHDVLLALRSRCVHLVNGIPEDGLLCGQTIPGSGFLP